MKANGPLAMPVRPSLRQKAWPNIPTLSKRTPLARRALKPHLNIERAEHRFFTPVTVNNALQVTVDPKKPVRGQSAFEADLCVFEQKTDDIKIPRLVMEFKHRITTHDIIT